MSQTIYPSIGGQVLKKRIFYVSGSSSQSTWVNVFTVTPSSGYRIFSVLVFICGSFQSTTTAASAGYRVRATYSDGNTYTFRQRTTSGTTMNIPCETPFQFILC